MTECTADFELGTDGSNVTTGDTGSATAWDAVTVAAGTITYSTAHAAAGSQCAAFSANSGVHCLEWSTALGTVTDHYGRLYLWYDANPAAFQIVTIGYNASSQAYAILVNSSGQLRINDGSGNLTTFTNAIALGQWVRLEWHVVHSATVGQVEVKLFNAPASTTATETFTSTADKNTQASQTRQVFGQDQGGFSALAFFLDEMVAGATSYPGPVGGTAQRLLASADSVDGAWHDNSGGTNLSGAIDESTFSDTDYITSELHPTTSSSRVKLAAGIDPASSTGHVIHWRVRKDAAAGDTVDMTVTLRQGGGNALGGGTQIATFSRTNVSGTGWTTYDETLSGGEADSITNYSDLYLEFTAST